MKSLLRVYLFACQIGDKNTLNFVVAYESSALKDYNQIFTGNCFQYKGLVFQFPFLNFGMIAEPISNREIAPQYNHIIQINL